MRTKWGFLGAKAAVVFCTALEGGVVVKYALIGIAAFSLWAFVIWRVGSEIGRDLAMFEAVNAGLSK